jgi:hypothetical protein
LQLWKTELPEAIETSQVRFKAFDFFAESPVEEQDIYYVSDASNIQNVNHKPLNSSVPFTLTDEAYNAQLP